MAQEELTGKEIHERFEAWAKTEGYDLRNRYNTEIERLEYSDVVTDSAWQGWLRGYSLAKNTIGM